jgi:hypothetical protein
MVDHIVAGVKGKLSRVSARRSRGTLRQSFFPTNLHRVMPDHVTRCNLSFCDLVIYN